MFNIPIQCTSLLKFYDVYVEILNCITKLSKQEKKILSLLLFIHYNNKTNIDVDNLLLNTETRKVIQDYLKISEANLNNLISSLKRKGIIKNNTILKSLINYPNSKDKIFNINFTLILNKNV